MLIFRQDGFRLRTQNLLWERFLTPEPKPTALTHLQSKMCRLSSVISLSKSKIPSLRRTLRCKRTVMKSSKTCSTSSPVGTRLLERPKDSWFWNMKIIFLRHCVFYKSAKLFYPPYILSPRPGQISIVLANIFPIANGNVKIKLFAKKNKFWFDKLVWIVLKVYNWIRELELVS